MAAIFQVTAAELQSRSKV